MAIDEPKVGGAPPRTPGPDALHVTPPEEPEQFKHWRSDILQRMNLGLAYCRMAPSDSGPDLIYLAVNDAFEKLTGLRNVLGKRITEVIPGIQESDPDTLCRYARVAATGAPEKFEIFVAALQQWLSVSLFSPAPGYFVAVFDVITARKQAEEEIRRSEQSLRLLFEEAPVPYHELDRDGTIVRVNRRQCDLFQLPASEQIGRPIWDFVVPEQRQSCMEAFDRSVRGPADPQVAEWQFKCPSGAILFLEFRGRLIRNEAGEVTGMYSAVIDRTEARLLDQRLESERSLLRSLMDQSSDHIYFKDREGRFTLANTAMAKLFGCRAPSDLTGKSDRDFFTAEHAGAAYQDEKDLVEGRVPAIAKEEKETWPDGRETWVHTTKRPLRDPSGEIIGTFGISRDITEQRLMEQTLRASENTLKLAEEALAIGTWELDIAADQAVCSRQLLQLYGLPGESLTRDQWLARLHPDDRDTAMADLKNAIEKSGSAIRRFRVVWPDGSVHLLQSMLRVISGPDDAPLRAVGIDFDITELAQREERLQVLSAAVEQCPVSVVITDLEGTIEYVNPRVTELTGYAAEELIGQNPRLLKSGETSPEEYSKLWQAIRSGAEWRGIFQNRRKNGELFWEAAAIRPICNAAGKPIHYLAVKEDITERRMTEDALRASEERFRIAAANVGDVIFEWDIETGNLNYLGASVRGKFPQFAPPSNTLEMLSRVHPEDVSQVAAMVERHFTTGEPLRIEHRMIQLDGSVIYVEVGASVVPTQGGGKRKSIGVVTDITARKTAELANAELAAIVGSADIAIFSRDLAGNILNWNAGAERIYGYSKEEIFNTPTRALFPPDHAHEDWEILETVKGGGTISHLETVRLRKDGVKIPVLLSASPMRNSRGEVIGAAYIVWEITQLKLLQQQLSQAQKLESIGQLASGVAHEINTPIQYIGDNIRFLASASEDLLHLLESPAATQCLAAAADDIDYLRTEIPNAIEQTLHGVERVAEIVKAMKRFSHPGPADRVPIDINEAIASTILVSRNEWKYVAELATDLDPAMPLVPCVAGEFNQVVLNLIVNAAHAIADVVKDSGTKGGIHITTRAIDGFAEVRVSDTGTGIPEAVRGRIFDPFFTTKDVGKGTGQGLAIAHSVIVQKHHGTISFETGSGVGTTFLIRLPLEDGNAAS